ncbi:methyltransferase, FkbM family [Arboricoccus pini]|uniref:Methyltransferase, FkbM family n=1 Tax=Arboricoccus pini TaxID=1963835 RepID=A0A212RDC3_9PROT|nr:FkbM family methyltransferase [Arboricoccus pini]SNB70255.1 methyltransferase, FkbM family [Arboricoccus pini]
MTFVSYAQNGEDVILWRALKDVADGFYVDVGANDPEEDSVTRAFYERGWRGINVEPVRQWYDRLCAARPEDVNLFVGCGASGGTITFYEIPDTGLSTTLKEVADEHRKAGWAIVETTIPMLRLQDICARRGDEPIHFLKIDVEGAERAVLEGLDLELIRPWIIVLEATRPGTNDRIKETYPNHPLEHRYGFAYFDGINSYFVAEEHAELIDRLAIQPNVFDRFQTRATRQLIERIDALDAREKALLENETALLENEKRLLQRLDAASALHRDLDARLHAARSDHERVEAAMRAIEQQVVQDQYRIAHTTELANAALAELKRIERHTGVRLLWSFGLFAPMRLPGRPRSKKPRMARIVDGVARRVTKMRKKMKKRWKGKKKGKLQAAGLMQGVVTAPATTPLATIEPPASLSPEARRTFGLIAPRSSRND